MCQRTEVLAKFQGAQDDVLHRSSTSDVFDQIACGRLPELAARQLGPSPSPWTDHWAGAFTRGTCYLFLEQAMLGCAQR